MASFKPWLFEPPHERLASTILMITVLLSGRRPESKLRLGSDGISIGGLSDEVSVGGLEHSKITGDGFGGVFE